MYGIDASPSMLTIAQEAEANTPILFLCQRMEELDLFGTIDTVVCTRHKSFNRRKDILQAFRRCSTFWILTAILCLM